jgi:hypothetical protein
MSATLLDIPIETPEPSASCAHCPAVERLERALEQLRSDFRREVGYWKSQHAKAVKRIEQLKKELDQSRGQVHALQDKLFGRKSEKSAQGNRFNDLTPRSFKSMMLCCIGGARHIFGDRRHLLTLAVVNRPANSPPLLE